jgi:Flp pilus assembly protein TadD
MSYKLPASAWTSPPAEPIVSQGTYCFESIFKVSFMFGLRSSPPAVLLLALCMLLSQPARAEQESVAQADFIAGEDITATDDILALNATMRSMVDTFVKPVRGKENRANALYNLMFGVDKFALKYDNSHTKTAVETIESGSGNCVSLANAFVAMARHAGLDAYYLDVKVPETWRRESDVYFQLKHVSAVVKVAPKDYLGIEYQWMGALSSIKPRIVDDSKAFAVYYSNRGIELLMQDRVDAAIAHLQHSIELDPDSANNWSNLGVALRRVNRLDEAEQAYLRALKQDKSDPTALSNLAILYQMTGRAELAAKYGNRLERHRRKNPYYLIDLAKSEMKAGNYELALKHARKAIGKYEDEHEFHFVAAQIYALTGDTDKAAASLKNAEHYAMSAMTKSVYSRKLEALATAAR